MNGVRRGNKDLLDQLDHLVWLDQWAPQEKLEHRETLVHQVVRVIQEKLVCRVPPVKKAHRAPLDHQGQMGHQDPLVPLDFLESEGTWDPRVSRGQRVKLVFPEFWDLRAKKAN